MNRALLLCLLVFLPLACGEKPQSHLPTTSLRIGTRAFTLEIAADDATREFGLMRRDDLPAGHGMIFIFPDQQPRKFWMRYTRFDLDIIFVAADGRVVSVKPMKAYDETNIPSDGPAKYAIELNSGAADDAGVQPGQTLALPPDVRAWPAK